jgi:hypothetical protein
MSVSGKVDRALTRDELCPRCSNPCGKLSDNLLGGGAVSVRLCLAAARARSSGLLGDPLQVWVEHVPAAVKRFGPLRLRAKRRTRDAEQEGLLLQATRVGDNAARMHHCRHHLWVWKRIGWVYCLAVQIDVELATARDQPRVREEHDGKRQCSQRSHDRSQPIWIVGVFRSVDGRHDIPGRHVDARGQRWSGALKRVAHAQTDIGHHVAYQNRAIQQSLEG